MTGCTTSVNCAVHHSVSLSGFQSNTGEVCRLLGSADGQGSYWPWSALNLHRWAPEQHATWTGAVQCIRQALHMVGAPTQPVLLARDHWRKAQDVLAVQSHTEM